MAEVGYPIAEIESNGEFTISKPEGSGGAVNVETVSEQMLYEVGDPANYLTPDVVADFTSIEVAQAGTDRVRITRVKGKPATDKYKVSIAYRDGYSSSGTLVIAGPNAAEKARRCGEMLLDRLARIGKSPAHSLIECLGAGDCVPGVLPTSNPPEVMLRVAVRDPDRQGRALHEGIRAARHVGPSGRHRLHDWATRRARGIRLLAGVDCQVPRHGKCSSHFVIDLLLQFRFTFPPNRL